MEWLPQNIHGCFSTGTLIIGGKVAVVQGMIQMDKGKWQDYCQLH